jgi:mannosylglucosylglycerate synthase
MNIALIHYRVGETDGVSLEMDKWKKILEKLGHKVVYIAGNMGNSDAYIIPELSLDNEEMKKIHNNAYYELKDYSSSDALMEAINQQAETISFKLCQIIEELKLDILVPNNILSLGHHIPAAIAIYNATKKKHIKILCHHHDFFWERMVFNNPTCAIVKDLLQNYFPPNDKFVSHCVINSIAQNALKSRTGLASTIVPNVFDFSQSSWVLDEYNSDLRSFLKIKENDLFFLQATRVTDRKAIELGIDLIDIMNSDEYRKKLYSKKMYNGKEFNTSSQIYLVLPGLSGEKESATGYKERLIEYAKNKKVNLIWCNEILRETRTIDNENKKYYSLWDFYANSDFITYPSIQEGWGNQFLEGLVAEKPMLIFEYPVFLSDIKRCGFEYVSLGCEYNETSDNLASVDKKIIDRVAEQCIEILTDKERYNHLTKSNFEKGDKAFSLVALEKILIQLFEDK